MLDKGREQAVRLIDFITKLSSLRTTQHRLVEDYEQVLWLSEIPDVKGCFSQLWNNETDVHTDIWLEVKYLKEPKIPDIPKQCLEFIDVPSLKNKESIPSLLFDKCMNKEQKSQIEQDEIDFNDGNTEPINPQEETDIFDIDCLDEDQNEINEIWEQYLENDWLLWVEKHNTWEAINEIYSTLFKIHQTILKLGEEYELIIGFGLLSWLTTSGLDIRRHLIVANAELDFEKENGTFTVKPYVEGLQIRLEYDMLDTDQMPVLITNEIKTDLAAAEVNPWSGDAIKNSLKKIAHSLHQDGTYEDDIKALSQRNITIPMIQYAPALILRKRSSYRLDTVLGDMRQSIKKGQVIPDLFRDLAEIPLSKENEEPDYILGTKDSFDDVYFPKPSNDEQYRIVRLLNSSKGILVQGPPGTGKSHTIANLICHLLATGKRILVTAKTPRALLVLNNLIPENVRPLCINLLGDGLEERQSLTESVEGILKKTSNWCDDKAENDLKILNSNLNALRKEEAEIINHLKDLRESETRAQSVINDEYKGTATQISQRLAEEAIEYNWLKDRVHYTANLEINIIELINSINIIRRISCSRKEEVDKAYPSTLIESFEFDALCNSEASLRKQIEVLSNESDESIVLTLSDKDPSLLDEFQNTIKSLTLSYQSIAVIAQPWMKEFIIDIIKSQLSVLKNLHRESVSTLKYVDSCIDGVIEDRIQYPANMDIHTLLADVSRLKDHIHNGGSIGWWVFRPKIVRESYYLLKSVKMNGEICLKYDQLIKLEKVLQVLASFDRVWELWRGRIDNHSGVISMQHSELSDLVEKLDLLLSTQKLVTDIREFCRIYGIVKEPNLLETNELLRFQNSIAQAILLNKLRGIESSLTINLNLLREFDRKADSHPVVGDLLRAVVDRDVNQFNLSRQILGYLINDRNDLSSAEKLLTDLHEILPVLSTEIMLSYDDDKWMHRLPKLQLSWNWASANSWIEDYIGTADIDSLNKRLYQIQDEISVNQSELTSTLAWKILASRLSESQRRHMISWKQSIYKLKGGTGKSAPRYRREAQQNLDECRDAVPAWVMPLHRIWDTIKPSPEIFDVVIIDEASQCGFEGIPLFYLAKKIIIVGDDKQISPEAIGIRQNTVHGLMDQYLEGFQYKGSFDIISSIFDHGKMRFSRSSVSLREHFRCMPEIIGFSNNLCYTETPLIPLRQYGTDRLTPLVHKFVENGYREGNDSRVINRPEAELIADTISDLCNKPEYMNKTMGVIVLQGEAQAGLIEGELLKRISVAEFDKRRLICGNPYSFQGDERDVIFLSLVAANNMRIGTLSSEPDMRRFNVAASRARDQMWLFHSVKPEDLSPRDLRRKLLEYFLEERLVQIAGIEVSELQKRARQDNRSIMKPPPPFDSWFELDVALDIALKGFEVLPQYEFAGRRLDIVVEGGQSRIAIECDGDMWHGADRYEDDMTRQRQLERCGWYFWRIRGSEYYANKTSALSGLWKALDDRGVLNKAQRQLAAMGLLATTAEPAIYNDQSRGNETESESEDIYDSTTINHEGVSVNGKRVEDVKHDDVYLSIIRILNNCPNNSCTIDSMTKRVLGDLKIITHGNPRVKFKTTVDDCINSLCNKNHIYKYKTSKNWRVKLVNN